MDAMRKRVLRNEGRGDHDKRFFKKALYPIVGGSGQREKTLLTPNRQKSFKPGGGRGSRTVVPREKKHVTSNSHLS